MRAAVQLQALRTLGWCAPVRSVPSREHDKLVEFSLPSFFTGPFIAPIADVQEDEED